MRKIELLAPAGDFDALKAAIASGANAVYIGGSSFSARAFAHNFDLESLKEAIDYAHLRNVKIHVTINTLYKDEEFDELLKYIDALYHMQVDAVLIQDIGLLKLVRKMYPDLEIHVSTQMSINSLEAIRYFENLGVKRIVLARENTIEEMRYITSHTSLEVEVFAHGAICVAYSGQCLMSSMIGQRSGNRGACAQPCRLKYTLIEDNKELNDKPLFLMSPRDLCTLENIDEFIDANITSIKLEGRMKKPEYVASIVTSYRKAIDHYYNKKIPSYSEEDYMNMKRMFNRNYTKGYAFSDYKLVDGDYSGNKGTLLGEVLSYNKKDKRVRIKLSDNLLQGDSIVFTSIDKGRPVNKIFLNNKLVNKATINDIVEIEFNYYVDKGNVNKTVSLDTINKIKATLKDKKYHNIQMNFYSYVNTNPTLQISLNDFFIEVSSPYITQKSINNPTDENKITTQLQKVGNTVFNVNEINIYTDNIGYIPLSVTNNLRRDALLKLENEIISQKKYTLGKKDYTLNINNDIYNSKYYIVVSNIKQLKEVINEDNVYYYYNEDIDKAIELFKEKGISPKIYLPRINNDKNIKDIYHKLKDYNDFIVNDYGLYNKFKDKNTIIGQGFNIYNHYSALSFKEESIISYECTPKQINEILNYKSNSILPIYGKVENMISEHCLISQYYFDKKVPHCQKCKGHTYKIKDRKDVCFDVFTDENCRNHILNSYPLYLKNHKKYNCSYLITFTNEDNISLLLDQIKNMNIIKDTTQGYY